ncbi:zinc-binding dehydrogenase [Microbacterium sp. SORGH_AS_0888]|uniref:zinc-dependent alcohol dehydrogenase n=1 Tax=Microbacterium sp. SORGH_AS_0888 TaxID=3041791 RepID=UPI00277D9E75|nr:alcohol dehydrogenase catalytic domain-containing protein [Microbacterium sp. SORGH_AS_0888]MDQ1129483.1 threonine dehydrogenase-like Zn-dependent dehydrogenase [Microbacterium sp. SORGH_AS_0888]
MTYVSMELVGYRRMAPVEREDRPLLSGQVRIAVRAANLCPTDVKKWDDRDLADRLGGLSVPLGHEFAGEIIDVAADVADLRAGDRVAVDPVLRCGRCEECVAGRSQFCSGLLGIGAAAGDPVACARLAVRDGIGGGFAEHVIVPATSCIPLPADLDYAAGSLVEPLADVMHGIEAARIVAGERAAVIGLGPMGLLHIEALRADGVEVVGVDLRDDRREVAAGLGVRAVHPDRFDTADVVFVTAGGGGHVPAIRLALAALAPGGRAVVFSSGPRGVEAAIDSNRLHYRRQSLIGVVGFDRRHAAEAVRVLRTGRVGVDLIRRPHVPLARVDDAFRAVQDPGVLKTAVDIPA